MKKLSLIIAALLAGCGGGGVDRTPAPAEPQVDEFFALVGAVVASSSEESDANEVDLVTPTSPDASDPETM
jgi:hypothetical protein